MSPLSDRRKVNVFMDPSAGQGCASVLVVFFGRLRSVFIWARMPFKFYFVAEDP